MKKYIGKFVRIKFKDMDSIPGVILDFNDEWILMRNIPVDYVIDGYFVIRNKHIKSVQRGNDEKWSEKIINLKTKKLKSLKIPITSLETILETLTKKYSIFTLYTKERSVCWLGKLIKTENKKVTIADLTPKAVWDGEMTFKTF
jgi:hypothetical protein